MGRIAWYKRDPGAALRGMQCLTLEERGAYNTVLDLIYDRANELPDDDRFIAGHCGCDVRVWRRIKRRLTDLGKLYVRDGHVRNQTSDVVVDECLARVVSSRNAALTKHGKLPPKSDDETNNNNNIDPAGEHADAPADALPCKSKNKKELGLGLEPRSLSPGDSESDPSKPDPNRFSISKDWSMPADVETRLTERFMPDLGTEGFWRQVERFIEKHIELGTLDTGEGFVRSLENWLKRADANRDPPPKTNGQTCQSNGTKQAAKNGFKIENFNDFARRSLAAYQTAMRACGGTGGLTQMEEIKLKSQAISIAGGADNPFGLPDGPQWEASDLVDRVQRIETWARP